MYRKFDPENIPRRIRMTPEEASLTKLLKQAKFKDFLFYKHHPIGEYIADFVCEDKKLIIDIFYGFYNNIDEQTTDNIRLKFFQNAGYKVLRFMDKDIELNLGAVYRQIQSELGILYKKNSDLTVDFSNPRYKELSKKTSFYNEP